jgi:hypothetical protein
MLEPLRKGAEAAALGQRGHGGLVGPQGLQRQPTGNRCL